MSEQLVRLHVADRVATITLDSQHNRNALSRRLLAELNQCLDTALDGADPEHQPRVVVLRHEGPAFCSGADLKERVAQGIPDSRPMIRAIRRLMESPVPTVAAVNGAVRAGGMGVMAACDLIVVHPDVTFSLPEVRIGVAPAIVLVPLLRRVPAAQLAATTLTAEPIDADTARRIGLVSHVAADVDGRVRALCDAVHLGAPRAVAESKHALWNVGRWPLDTAFEEMQALSEKLFNGPDAAEGMRAFAEKRPPTWAAG